VSLQSTGTIGTSSPDSEDSLLVAREKRFANAIRLRRAAIRIEMEACLHGREEAYSVAEAFLDEFDELAEIDKLLRAALSQVELRLQRTGAFFLSDKHSTGLQKSEWTRGGSVQISAWRPSPRSRPTILRMRSPPLKQSGGPYHDTP
jgi:hypothetical protein